jgi:A/G-specific adenine glycosylase
MDYGAYLKKIFPNPNRKSKHYAKQSKFEGSNRQVRGIILKLLLNQPLHYKELIKRIPRETEVSKKIINELLKEGLIKQTRNSYSLN